MVNGEACAICGGAKEDHKKSQHEYTVTPGALRPRENPKASQREPVVVPVNSSPEVARLVQVMLEKGIFSSEDALYIFIGQRPARQFADPSQLIELREKLQHP